MDEVSRREQIKDMELAQLRAKVSLLSSFDSEVDRQELSFHWFTNGLFFLFLVFMNQTDVLARPYPPNRYQNHPKVEFWSK